ncbi:MULTISPECIES: Ltp family lipoprotein [Corynebacterium]|uniref:Putative host cell surface-exposed lipoprotein Ltp-like HTH region domain-containing protein n=1 Tax=Corynebacterium coyleae TaxID=53374 RepID=A0AAP7CCD8_9CORY|nr:MULTISPECIES: Ltp family lipoprotein [Corynebacterium]NJJ03935.1 hypothetical protein [Corynebacterium coyleae]
MDKLILYEPLTFSPEHAIGITYRASPLAGFLLVVGLVGCSPEATEPADSAPAEEVTQEAAAEEAPAEETPADDVPQEYKSALKKAKLYSDTMHMSKAGIYNQLTSDYGEQFSAEAAQYAIDNVEADWKENALQKAITYQKDLAMSPSAIRDQLVSSHGEKFTEEEADYAIANLPE